jgi:uncharacterized protein (DUF2141 family)
MRLNELPRAVLCRRGLLAYILFLLLLPGLASLCSCASGQGTPPPGGPKDTTAPAVLETEPPSGTTNFHERSVAIRFSEILPENGVPEAVTITPIPVTPPQYDWNWSGNTLEITFSEPLLENRTYTITLGASVADLAGNRLGRPYTLRFSTGDKIDSGRIQGEVIGKARGKAFVFAYQIPAGATDIPDFHPDSVRPDFIAPIGDDGTFSLEGLPPGRFRLLAVVDEFGDQLYSPGQDAYGVPVGDVQLDSATVPVTGVSFRLRSGPDDLTPPALYSATSLAMTRTSLRFNEPVDSASLRPANFTVSAGTTTGTVREVWRSPTNALAVELSHDALPAGAEATVAVRDIHDTIGHAIPDSVSRTTFTVSDARDTLPPALLPLEVDSLHPYAFTDSLRFLFDEAVGATSLDGAVSIADTAGPRAPFRVRQISPTEFVARPIDTLFGVVRGVIEINLGRFTDMAGNRRDSTTRMTVPIAPPRQIGTLQGTLTDSAAPTASHVIVVRAVSGGATYRKIIRSGPWEFTTLPEGEYEVSAFRDSDGNGAYDYGSLTPFRFAEAYAIWHGTVRVRPRWVTNKIDLVVRG